MARLSQIATQIKTMLEGMTVDNGYSFDAGSINDLDHAAIFPALDITYLEEENLFNHGDALSYFNYALATFKIRVRCRLLSIPSVPLHAIDAEIDTVVSSMKRALGINNGVLALDFEAVISYAGFTKQIETSGEMFSPTTVLTTWKVKYQDV
jgi:hypothetical protein